MSNLFEKEVAALSLGMVSVAVSYAAFGYIVALTVDGIITLVLAGVAVAASFLMAIDWERIHFGTEARPYALVEFLASGKFV